MTGKMSNKIVGYKYSLGMHMILCQEADALLGITAGDRVLLGWTSTQFGSPVDSLPTNWGRAFSGSVADDETSYMKISESTVDTDKGEDLYKVFTFNRLGGYVQITSSTPTTFEDAKNYFANKPIPQLLTVYDSAENAWVLVKERITRDDRYEAQKKLDSLLYQEEPMDLGNMVKYSVTPPDFKGFFMDKFFTFTKSDAPNKFDGFSTLGYTKNQTIYLSKPDIFGGSDRAGGITGDMALLFGGPEQLPNAYLAKYFVDSNGKNWCPSFKGVVSVVLERVYVGVSPYLQNWAFLLRRIPFGATDFATKIDWRTGEFVGNHNPSEDYKMGVIQARDHHYDANPAYIIKDCITSVKYGMGYPLTRIGESFEIAAKRLYEEKFGLSLIWDKQSSTGDFIQNILNHINAVLYVSRDRGLYELKLLRADYTYSIPENPEHPNTPLITLDTSNVIRIDNFQRVGWGETSNEVVVQYSNRITGTGDAVTVQDLANIQTQGMVVSTTKTYPGIHDSELAARVAQRDLQILSTPVSKVRLIVNREASSLRAGDVFIFSWPPLEIISVVYRVGAVSLGTLTNSEVVIDAVEDIFALPVATYMGNDKTVTRPSTVQLPITDFAVKEACFFDIVRHIGMSNVENFSNDSAWAVGIAVAPYSESSSFLMDIFTQDVDHTKDVDSVTANEQITGYYSPSCVLTEALGLEVLSHCSYTSSSSMYKVKSGELGYIENEMVCIAYNDTEERIISLYRGVIDTCPTPHSAGARLFITSVYSAPSYYELVEGDHVAAYFRALHPLGLLARSSSPYSELTLRGRAAKPYPPGKLQVNGLAPYSKEVVPYGDLSFSWAHRNRFQQTVRAIYQDEGDISPVEAEGDTGYVVRLVKDGTPDETIFSISFMLGRNVYCPYALLTRGANYRLTVFSLCNTLISYTGNMTKFTLGENPVPVERTPSAEEYVALGGQQRVDVPNIDPEATSLANMAGAYGLWVND
jgi:hypothetical protein